MTAVSARWHAPGRVNLIGEHTDYNAGFALPFAIEQTCTALVARAEPGSVRVTSTAAPAEVTVRAGDLRPDAELAPADRWARYPLGVLWSLAQRGRFDLTTTGLSIALDSDVPVGAGLSSSASIVCSVATATNDLLGLELGRSELLAITRQAENDYVGAPTGGMDQLAALRCTAGHALLCDMRSLETEQVPFDPDGSGLRLLVVDSKAEHGHADGEYRDRREACERAAAALGVTALRDATLEQVETLGDPVLRRRARHIVTENARVLDVVDLLRAGRLTDIGPALTASHVSMRDDFEITAPEVDTIVDVLLAEGALGARMTGGGFGGCVIGLVPAADVERHVAAVRTAFAAEGFAAPHAFVERPAAGARPADEQLADDEQTEAGAR